MAIATTELDRTEHRHPAAHGAQPSILRHPAARRPAPLMSIGLRAATRSGVRVQVRRGAAVLALLMIAVAMLAVVAFGQGSADAAGTLRAAGASGQPSTSLVVSEGETVWDLVLPHLPAGADVQGYVAAVLEHNGLRATAVRPGAVIRLP